MAPFETLLAFAAATVVFGYMPGPAMLYTAAQTLARGREAGFHAAIGIHVGCYVHVFAAALGLSAIFMHVPAVYTAVKLAGAVYLIWLGIGLIRQKIDPDALPTVKARSKRKAFFESFMVEVLNPKVAIFFIAFLPQFVDPAGAFPVWVQFLILGMIVNFTFTSADFVCVLLASSVMRGVKASESALRFARWAGGSLLMGLGVRLALVKD